MQIGSRHANAGGRQERSHRFGVFCSELEIRVDFSINHHLVRLSKGLLMRAPMTLAGTEVLGLRSYSASVLRMERLELLFS